MRGVSFGKQQGNLVVTGDSSYYAVIIREHEKWVVCPHTKGSNYYDDSHRNDRTRRSFLAAVRLAIWFVQPQYI